MTQTEETEVGNRLRSNQSIWSWVYLT